MTNWKGYVIRKTYQEGAHKGESCIYIKTGYVKTDNKKTFIFPDECYSKLSTAKGVVTRYYKQQEQDIRLGNFFNIRSSYEVVEVVNGRLV